MLRQYLKMFIRDLYMCFVAPFKYSSCKILSFIPPSCKLGKNVIISKNCMIKGNVKIGDCTFLNEGVRLDSNTRSIGNFCSISHDVKIGLGPHPSNYISTSPVFYSTFRGFVKEQLYNEYLDKGYTNIGHDVLIGANAVVLAGVTVGTGAIIGACSLVNKDVPPYAVVGGVPAKVIRYRFAPEIITLLLQSEWWNEDVEVLLQYKNLIKKPGKFIQTLENDRRRG